MINLCGKAIESFELVKQYVRKHLCCLHSWEVLCSVILIYWF